MRARLGTILLWGGAAAGVLAVALGLVGLPTTLPPALLALLAIKLAAAAAVGLLAAGAYLRRTRGRPLPPERRLPTAPDAPTRFPGTRTPEPRAPETRTP